MRTAKRKQSLLKRREKTQHHPKEPSVKAKEELQELSNNLHELEVEFYKDDHNLIHGWSSKNSTRKAFGSNPDLDRFNRTAHIIPSSGSVQKYKLSQRPKTSAGTNHFGNVYVHKRTKCQFIAPQTRLNRYRCRTQFSPMCYRPQPPNVRPQPSSRLQKCRLRLRTPTNCIPPNLSTLMDKIRSPFKTNIYSDIVKNKSSLEKSLRKLSTQDIWSVSGKTKIQQNEAYIVRLSSRVKKSGSPPKKYLDYMQRINKLISEERVGLQSSSQMN